MSETWDAPVHGPHDHFPSVHRTPPARVLRPRPTPAVRLFTDRLVVERGDLYDSRMVEVDAAVLSLSFDYPALRLAADDPRERIFYAAGGGMTTMERDAEAEADARAVLERFGAVDLECLEHYGASPDSGAHYLVRLEGDRHDHCEFTANAVPELRRLGWTVEVDGDYPYQVLQEEVSWYAVVRPSDDRPDWFNLELGIEVGGQRVNMLPVLLDLLDNSAEGSSLEAVLRRADRFLALPVSETHNVQLTGERLRALFRVVIELYEGDAGKGRGHMRLGFGHLAAGALDRLDRAFRDEGELLAWDDPSRARQRGVRLSTPPAPESVREPADLRATLRPYQKAGLAWLQHLVENEVGGILADDMGLGKTLQTISHIAAEKSAGRLQEPALVVAPTSLVGNWSRELEKFAPHLRKVVLHGTRRHELWDQVREADVVVTTYGLVVRDEARFEGRVFHLLILDEAHTIKNRRSLSHKAVRAIQARHRLCLTGTPVENHLGEMYSLFDFLNPGMLGEQAFFKQWFQNPIERDGDEERLGALCQQVAPYILRRMKSEVAKELPPKTEIVQPVELEGKQRELYESIRIAAHAQVRQLVRRKGFAASAIPILDALMKLRQVCCDPRLVRMEAARFVKQSAKYAALMELLETQLSQGHRVLVFSQFTTMLGLISDGLRERGVRHLALTGASRDRQKLVDQFEAGKADVFLLSLKAAGTGLNLVSADTVVHYDPWWNPTAQAQATDRAYRIGQTRPVFVHNLIVAGSVEERMLELQTRKRHLAQAILGGGGEGLRECDLEELFAPLSG